MIPTLSFLYDLVKTAHADDHPVEAATAGFRQLQGMSSDMRLA
jgi:hypothetical protein